MMMIEQQVYQADPNTVQMIQSMRDHLQHCGRQCLNRMVRIQTIDGHVYEGMIENVDNRHLYLRVRQANDQRQFFPGYYYNPADVILPLVLYELLVISLLV
jgi:hypothetical protein